MTSKATTVNKYLSELPEDRIEPITKLKAIIAAHLPSGFEECMSYGMIGFVVPLTIFPEGYLGKKDQPLPFINIASQKNHIALYHSGLYANPELFDWFTNAYKTQVPTKLDMGKSCIRWKNPKHIPFSLIAELAKKMTVQQWIAIYQKSRTSL